MKEQTVWETYYHIQLTVKDFYVPKLIQAFNFLLILLEMSVFPVHIIIKWGNMKYYFAETLQDLSFHKFIANAKNLLRD